MGNTRCTQSLDYSCGKECGNLPGSHSFSANGKNATATQLLSLPVAAAVDVVNAEEELVQFAYQRSQELQTLVKEKLPALSS